MKKNIFIVALLLIMAACSNRETKEIPVKEVQDYCSYVNPFIGTGGKGHTYPGATVPHGMVQLSPDNGRSGWDRISGYFYEDTTIASFSHTHFSGTGVGDLYDIPFMPVTVPFKSGNSLNPGDKLGVYSTFSHNDEHAEPGYYSVLLRDYNIKVELTATKRAGFWVRFLRAREFQ